MARRKPTTPEPTTATWAVNVQPAPAGSKPHRRPDPWPELPDPRALLWAVAWGQVTADARQIARLTLDALNALEARIMSTKQEVQQELAETRSAFDDLKGAVDAVAARLTAFQGQVADLTQQLKDAEADTSVVDASNTLQADLRALADELRAATTAPPDPGTTPDPTTTADGGTTPAG